MMPAPRDRPSGDSLGGMKRGGCFGAWSARRRRRRHRCSSVADLEMALARRDHQRRLAEVLVARVDGGAVLEQRLRERGLADARREHQRRLAGAIARRGIGAGVEQPARQRRVAGLDRQVQRRDAVAIRRVHVGAGRDRAARAVSRSPTRTAQCSAGVPSRLGALTSTSPAVEQARARPARRRAARLRRAASTARPRRAARAALAPQRRRPAPRAAARPTRATMRTRRSNLDGARAVGERLERHVELAAARRAANSRPACPRPRGCAARLASAPRRRPRAASAADA